MLNTSQMDNLQSYERTKKKTYELTIQIGISHYRIEFFPCSTPAKWICSCVRHVLYVHVIYLYIARAEEARVIV